MRKALYIITLAVLSLACSKDVSVTRDHPVKADFEPDRSLVSMPVVWMDLTSCDEAGDAVNAYMAEDKSGLALFITRSSFEGGAYEWFETNSPSWQASGKSSLGLISGDRCLFACTSSEGSLGAIDLGGTSVIEFMKGEYSLTLGSIPENKTEVLLQKTYFDAGDMSVIYALELQDASMRLSDASFADCLSGQFGPVFMAGSRTDYLYTGPGVWNSLGGISLVRLHGQEGSTVISFTINAEEDRL